jgi:hypothetical protein
MPLLQSQRNEIFKALQDVGVDTAAFRWQLVKRRRKSPRDQFSHRSARHWLVIETKPSMKREFDFPPLDAAEYRDLFPITSVFHYAYAPGPESEQMTGTAISWEGMLSAVNRWAQLVARELSEPDLWLQADRQLHGRILDAGDVENTPFSPDEQQELAQRVDLVRERVVEEHRLDPAQLRALNEQLDELKQAASRLNRLDWRNAFLGAMFSLLLTAAVPPEAIRDIVELTLHSLAGLFGHPFPELHG